MIRKLIFRAVIGCCLLLAPVALMAYFYPEKILCVDSGPVAADVIVVLGGGVHEQRAERAAELFRQRAAPRILITGAGDDEINRIILLQNGVPAGVIEMEGDSTTTRENAEFTFKRLRAEKVRRVILDRADWPRHGTGRRMRLEFLKLAGYWLRYGVNPF